MKTKQVIIRILVIAGICFGVYLILEIWRAYKNVENNLFSAIKTGFLTAILGPVTLVENAYKGVSSTFLPPSLDSTNNGQTYQQAQDNWQSLQQQYQQQNGNLPPQFQGDLQSPDNAYWSSLANSLSFGIFGSNGDN